MPARDPELPQLPVPGCLETQEKKLWWTKFGHSPRGADVPYLLRLSRFRQDQSEKTQADLLVLRGSFTYLGEKEASAVGERARWDVRGRSGKQQEEETPLQPTKWVLNGAPSTQRGIQSGITREDRKHPGFLEHLYPVAKLALVQISWYRELSSGFRQTTPGSLVTEGQQSLRLLPVVEALAGLFLQTFLQPRHQAGKCFTSFRALKIQPVLPTFSH